MCTTLWLLVPAWSAAANNKMCHSFPVGDFQIGQRQNHGCDPRDRYGAFKHEHVDVRAFCGVCA
jgi:hypothetical protein